VQHSYHDISHWTSINLMPFHLNNDGSADGVKEWMVTGVEVGRAYRGQGHASRLLSTVVAEADAEGVTLHLMVAPDGTGLDAEALVAFYSSKGFAHDSDKNMPDTMTRHPQSERSVVHA